MLFKSKPRKWGLGSVFRETVLAIVREEEQEKRRLARLAAFLGKAS